MRGRGGALCESLFVRQVDLKEQGRGDAPSESLFVKQIDLEGGGDGVVHHVKVCSFENILKRPR